jgi:membrane protease YdiL (CAAX protease family)
MSRAMSARRPAGHASPPRLPEGYLQRSELPLTSLVFLLPLIVVYEVGTVYFASQSHHQTEQRIIAFTLMQQFFLLFGATGKYLPAMAVVGILLAWHIARRDAWQVSPATVMGMTLESLVLAVPLIVMGFAAARYVVLFAARGHPGSLLILSIGAGVYEELVFRLVAFTVLNFFLLDVLRLQRWLGYLLMVLSSSVLFALYHYLGEPFSWQTFAFRTLAGIYFGLVFIYRGFGVTAGSHAAYDILIVLLRMWAAR